MASGDGLLLRVRPRRGRISVAQLQGLARAAAAHGNGIIELTRRASLQLRGVSPESLPDLQAELRRLELAEGSRAVERQPVLLLCPLAGLDPRSALLEPLAAELERVLAQPALQGLSEKLLLALSGGSDVLARLEADVSIELSADLPGVAQLGVASSSGQVELGSYPSSEVPLVVERLLGLLGATAGAARMRALLAARGVAGLRAALEPLRLSAAPRFARFSVPPLGFHPAQPGGSAWLGLQLPFGSAPAAAWLGLAELARDFGSAEARLMPGRCVLLPGVREAERAELLQRARQHFIVERPTPWLELVACSGAPACRSASVDTRALALELAPLLRTGLRRSATLHVSGCEKGCAWGGPADITLLHGPDGYRLGFGAELAQTARTAALGLDAVRERLSRGLEQ